MTRYSIGGREFESKEALPEAIQTDSPMFLVEVSGRYLEIFRKQNGELSDGWAVDGADVSIVSERDQLIARWFRQAGKSQGKAGQHTVKAPMPGLVKKILISVGAQVSHDTPILILEAMKMENVLVAGYAGTVKEIKLAEGNNAEKNTILAIIE